MTILFLIIGFLIIGFGVFYNISNKKKLPDENLVEFEKTIKPKIIKYLLLPMLPTVLLCVYVINGLESFNILLFVCGGLLQIIIALFGYFQSKKIINQSNNAACFSYFLNFFIFYVTGQLFILATLTSSLNDVFKGYAQ
jgi:hypothetical protein